MRAGFTLLELIFALLIFQLGVLATAGMVHMAQRILMRSHLTVRGIIEARWIADSLASGSTMGEGTRSYPWGDISWAPASDELGGVSVVAFVPALGDTVAELRAVMIPVASTVLTVGGGPEEARW